MEQLVRGMHGFYAYLIDEAATMAQYAEAPYFGLIVHQRQFEHKLIIHPTVNLYI
ncbi:TPA: hypothetical protein HA234_01205 [Candidatus Woesearchaeota archaeon]|nr:hypothetical protein [Candidatus Woesearchaeota archaeon]HIG92796.1 hypothetical protein [Candidatus Woesearchaeota archaeon]